MNKLGRTGIVELRLASGPIPHYKEIVELSGSIIEILVNEFGTEYTIRRFSDPLWFNCFACTVGFEWQFSGMSTVPLKALKEFLDKENLGIKIVGGKGKESKAIDEISNKGDKLNLKTKEIEEISEASILSCKVDSCEIQDNHHLYFHSILIDEKGNYTTINQKMNVSQGTVRRFHWVVNPSQFVEEPYSGTIGNRQGISLDLSSKSSKECRETIVDIVRDEMPEKICKTILTLDEFSNQKRIIDFLGEKGVKVVRLPYYLKIPRKLNLDALRIAHELASKNFQEILGIEGIGPATIRGLAYISKLIYGAPLSFNDPVKYTFAFGTKASVPYPVNKQAMRESAKILRDVIIQAKLENREKVDALKRLNSFLEL
ncbi:MAG: DUF763 domain-containing protein [Candidatus Aenigmatarchaeota archaeon]